MAYYPQDRLLFTSKLFAAHVSPDIVGNPRTNAGDLGGFDVFGKDWKYYFDCMLAPVARQADGTDAYVYVHIFCVHPLNIFEGNKYCYLYYFYLTIIKTGSEINACVTIS